ncbi:hypothetical protein FRX31_030530, partial [Thalictrum thalictroides]
MVDLWSIGRGKNSFSAKGVIASDLTHKVTVTNASTKISYADKVRKPEQPIIEYSELPEPGFRGEYPTIKLPKKAYERGLEYCKFSLIGRLDMQGITMEE